MRGIVVAAAFVTAVSVSAREIVPLSGEGWTADGDPLGRPVVFGGDSI